MKPPDGIKLARWKIALRAVQKAMLSCVIAPQYKVLKTMRDFNFGENITEKYRSNTRNKPVDKHVLRPGRGAENFSDLLLVVDV